MSFQNKLSPYIDIVHPKRFKDFINKSKNIQGLKPSFYNVLIATIITLLFTVLQNTALIKVLKNNIPTDPAQAATTKEFLFILERTLAPEIIVVNFIIAIAFFYILQYLFHLIIKLLGGKGSFNSHAYLMSILYVCFILVSLLIFAILLLLYNNRQPDALIGILALFVLVYILYIFYSILRGLHNLSLLTAIIAIAVFIAIFIFMSSALERALLRLILNPVT